MAKKGAKKKSSKKKSSERIELLWRILVGVVTGIILGVWRYLIFALIIIHFIVVLFSGKRDRGLADFSEYWNSEAYRYVKYLTFASNERPFPFTPLKRVKPIEM